MAFAKPTTLACRDREGPRSDRSRAMGHFRKGRQAHRFEVVSRSRWKKKTVTQYADFSGFIMSLHIMSSSHPSSSPTRSPQLRILTGYENGGVCLWAHVKDDDAVSIEGRGWEALWQVKAHVESGER